MKIEKLTAGTYRVRQQYKGKRYTVYFDHKPSQKEALQAMSAELDRVVPRTRQNGSVDDYLGKYISDCEERGVSPSTVCGYESLWRNISKEFKCLLFYDVTCAEIQREVDLYSQTHAAKGTRNMYGLIRSTFAKYRPELALSIKLPTREVRSEYEPTTKDIQTIIEYSVGTRYHIPLQLAILGLRRGETCALTLEDLSDDNVLTINKDLVLNKDNNYVIKDHAKTQASNRRILLPSALADEIREQGYIWHGNPHTINEYLHKAQDALGIPRFRLHMLRHFCVAYLHKQGFTSEQIMGWGGWETDSVMKRAYRYNLDPSESKRDIADKLGGLF